MFQVSNHESMHLLPVDVSLNNSKFLRVLLMKFILKKKSVKESDTLIQLLALNSAEQNYATDVWLLWKSHLTDYNMKILQKTNEQIYKWVNKWVINL